MRVRFLGVGGAFDPEYGSSSALVETGDGTLTLIDCGCTTYSTLKRIGEIDRVTHILITHLHDDHVGSLGSAIYHQFYLTGRKATLVFPPGLRQPLLTLLGAQHTGGPIEERVNLAELADDPDHPSRTVGATRIDWIETTGLHQKNMPSFGYVFRRDEAVVAYSGDLGDPDIVFEKLERRGLTGVTVFHDMFFRRLDNPPHAWYKDLERHLDRWIIRGYHNDPTQKPDDCRITLVWEDPTYSPSK